MDVKWLRNNFVLVSSSILSMVIISFFFYYLPINNPQVSYQHVSNKNNSYI
jgi:hypothetical protein